MLKINKRTKNLQKKAGPDETKFGGKFLFPLLNS